MIRTNCNPPRRGLLLLSLCLFTAAACADPPVTWPFDIQTSGEDVHFVSPTAVDPQASQYDMSYVISQVRVKVRYLVFTYTVDITGEIPPEYLTGSAVIPGPAPIVLHDGDIAYPAPPEPPSFAAHLVIGLNAAGHGYMDMTNVYLGTAQINIPPFGLVTVQLVTIYVTGSVTAQAVTYTVGDLNCDGAVNFDDINPFVLALSDPAGYQAAFPDCPIANGDVNGDGFVNFDDINPFVALLTGR